jgi:hypothetical protein
MSKFNGFEKFIIVSGVERVALEMKCEIRNVEEKGKNPLMTVEYVDMVLKELLDKVNSFTIKEKKYR